jgi:hypothetical protein
MGTASDVILTEDAEVSRYEWLYERLRRAALSAEEGAAPRALPTAGAQVCVATYMVLNAGYMVSLMCPPVGAI